MNRTLRRPMFRIGGSAGEGITSGLAPRQGYNLAGIVKPINFEGTQAEWEAHLQNLREKKVGPFSEYSLSRKNIVPDNTDSTDNNFVGDDTGTQNIIDKVTERKSILDAMYPRQKTDSMAGANFLMNLGVDLASRPRSGNIFQQVATSAKNPLLRFQEEKLMEQAAGRKETSEDRALLAKMLEGMDDDKLSAMMKKVEEGVRAGYYKDEKDGIWRQLQEEEFGVQDMPGEARDRRISKLEDHYLSIDNKSGAYARDVAEHQYKMETGAYPKRVEDDLSKYPIYIKPAHKARDIKPEYDDQGQIIKFVVQGKFYRTYEHEKIFLDPETGNLFKRVGSKGQAPVFQRVDFE